MVFFFSRISKICSCVSVLDVIGALLFVDGQHGTLASAGAGLSIVESKLSTENGNLLEWRSWALGDCVAGIADDVVEWSCGILLPVESVDALKFTAPVSTVG